MKRIVLLLGGLVLVGCDQVPEKDVESQKRLQICKDVMKRYITEAHLYERDWEKTIGSCNISQMHRTTEQWECVLKGMEGGEKYVDASDRCGSLKPIR